MTNIKQIIDKATRDITKVSVAPASKSEVRVIVAKAIREVLEGNIINPIGYHAMKGSEPEIIMKEIMEVCTKFIKELDTLTSSQEQEN